MSMRGHVRSINFSLCLYTCQRVGEMQTSLYVIISRHRVFNQTNLPRTVHCVNQYENHSILHIEFIQSMLSTVLSKLCFHTVLRFSDCLKASASLILRFVLYLVLVHRLYYLSNVQIEKKSICSYFSNCIIFKCKTTLRNAHLSRQTVQTHNQVNAEL